MADDPLIPPNGPAVPGARALPFSTLLTLTQEQEQRMVDDAFKRIDDLKAQMGWTGQDTAHPDLKSWCGIREIAEKKWGGKLGFRAVSNKDGTPSIFESSNVSLNTVKHQARDLVASVVNNTVGTKPFFTTLPAGNLPEPPDVGSSPQTALAGPAVPSPVSLAKDIGMFADDKIDASNCEDGLRQGLQTTCIKGEQVYKVAHKFDTNHTRGQGPVLCDARGNVIYTKDGDVVTPDDIQANPDGSVTRGAPVAKDPTLEIPDGAQIVSTVYDRVNIAYQGPHVGSIHHKSWLCPLNIPDIHEGTNVFLYDLPTEEVARLYRHPAFVKKYSRTPVGDEAMAILADLERETSEPKTVVSMPNHDHGEEKLSANDDNYRVMQIAEFYDKRDIDGDGNAEEFILVLDVKNKRALYYNYLDQVFPSGRRPFEVTTLGRVANRWYGSGLFEQYDRQETFIDTQLNRANYRNSAAGRVDGYDPEGTEETAAGEAMGFGMGYPYKLKPGKKLADVFQSVTMPPMTDEILDMMEKMIQSVQVEGGNIGAADGSTSGLNVSKTAYGVRNIEQNKDSLQGFYEDEMQVGVLKVMNAAVNCVFAHMDDVEQFSYTEKDKQILRTIKKSDVKGLKYKVSLSLLQKNTAQNLQNITTAVALGKDYLALPTNLQKALRPALHPAGQDPQDSGGGNDLPRSRHAPAAAPATDPARPGGGTHDGARRHGQGWHPDRTQRRGGNHPAGGPARAERRQHHATGSGRRRHVRTAGHAAGAARAHRATVVARAATSAPTDQCRLNPKKLH